MMTPTRCAVHAQGRQGVIPVGLPQKKHPMRLQLIGLIVTLAFGLLLAPLTTEAQQPTKVYRIGRLSSWSPSPDPNVEAFRQHLRDLGYVEGHNLVLELRYAAGRAERLPDLAAELVQLQVEVIMAEGAAAIRAAQHATRTIPIVMAATSDPGWDKGSSPAWRTRGGTSRA